MQPNTLRALTALLLFTGACDGKPKVTVQARPPVPTPPVAPAPEPRPVVVALPAPTPVGMEDPFGRSKQTTVNTLNAGYKAVRQKKPAEARAAFHAVVAAQPDHNAARFEELKAAVAEGDYAGVPELWRALLERDFIGYSEKLERAKDLAPLRASRAWADVQAIKSEVKARYTAGLDKGFLFVARLRPHGAPAFAEYSDTAALELEQEVYQFDPGTRRIKRLTETGGHVVAIHRQGAKVIVLTSKTLKKAEGGTAFSKPEASLLALDTLEKTGPLTIDGDARKVAMCFSPKGEPIWTVSGAVETKALTLDATGSTLVPLEEGCGATLATTTADPLKIAHHRPDPEGVTLSDDGLQVNGVDSDRPVRSDRAIRPGSLSWSPGKKRFAYAGAIEGCVPSGTDKKKAEPNALFVWDAVQKKAARVVAEPADYETEWLDDDHLAYEAHGSGPAKLTVQDFGGGTATVLKVPAGAGLHGLAALPCQDGSLALAR
jgi:hypothetical protein